MHLPSPQALLKRQLVGKVYVPYVRIPEGRMVELPGRGSTYVTDTPGPSPDSPAVVLLHAVGCTGLLTWFPAIERLAERFRVITLDQRWHGRGIQSENFSLADCADDVAALMDVEGIDEAIVVGYSMGGPIAQLLWRRHPEKVAGLVLCATSDRFVPGRREQLVFVTAMGAIAGTTRLGDLVTRVPIGWIQSRVAGGVRSRPETFRRWARAEMRRHDWRMVAEATGAIGNYNASRWIGEVDVPTAVLVTTEDKAVAPIDQARLALRIPGATMHKVDDGHILCAKPRFGRVLRATVDEVAGRIA